MKRLARTAATLVLLAVIGLVFAQAAEGAGGYPLKINDRIMAILMRSSDRDTEIGDSHWLRDLRRVTGHHGRVCVSRGTAEESGRCFGGEVGGPSYRARRGAQRDPA